MGTILVVLEYPCVVRGWVDRVEPRVCLGHGSCHAMVGVGGRVDYKPNTRINPPASAPPMSGPSIGTVA